jgi:hypothetical protein
MSDVETKVKEFGGTARKDRKVRATRVCMCMSHVWMCSVCIRMCVCV